jgi:hypothetical protein
VIMGSRNAVIVVPQITAAFVCAKTSKRGDIMRKKTGCACVLHLADRAASVAAWSAKSDDHSTAIHILNVAITPFHTSATN